MTVYFNDEKILGLVASMNADLVCQIIKAPIRINDMLPPIQILSKKANITSFLARWDLMSAR